MHINSFFMRANAFDQVNRLFGDRSDHGHSFDRGHTRRTGHFGRSDENRPHVAMRDAMKAIIDVVAKETPDSITKIALNDNGREYVGIRGSDNADTIVYASASKVRAAVNYLDAGGGNDVISASGGQIGEIFGGDGNDAIAAAGYEIRRIDGGSGNDAIAAAGRTVHGIDGGAHDDTISVSGSYVSGANGGDGNDTIAVSGDFVMSVHGGAGDDVISVSSDTAHHQRTGHVADYEIYANEILGTEIEGGEGNDTISIDGEAHVIHRKGGGQDTITINDRTTFIMVGDDLYDETMDVKNATFTFGEDGSLTVSYEGRDEQLTIRSASGGDLKLEFVEDPVFDRRFVVTAA